MNITRENIDTLNEVIRIHMDPADYNDKVEHTLADYRKKVRFDGFRPGKVPLGLVKKVYGKAILVDEVNKLLSDTLNTYISENKIQILGEPIPNDNSPEINWDLNSGFEFHFDIGLVPEFELKVTKRDKVTQYKIEVAEKMIDDQIENFARRFGTTEPVEEVADKDVIKVDLVQLDESGEPLEDGITVFDTMIGTDTIADKKILKSIIGSKINDEFILDLTQTFPNETDRAAMLKLKKEEIESATGNFRVTIREVNRFVQAEVNQELFDKTFGEGEVNSLEDYRNKIKEGIENQLSSDTDYKLHLDTKEKVLLKIEVELPDEFLKRWMLLTSKDEKLTKEKLESEYPLFSEDLKWQLIKNKVAAENELKAEEEEVRANAIQVARMQYQQYGLYQVPDEHLARLAENILKEDEERRKIVERIIEKKVISHLQTLVKIEEKSVSMEEFQKMFD